MSKSKREDFEEQLRALQQDIGFLSQKLAIPTHKDSTLERDRDSSRVSVISEDASGGTPRGEMARLKKDFRTITRERDDALYRLEQMKKENEELRKSASELSRVKALCDHLHQDNESLKTSLESSEKLRKQQKELIQILQSSHAAIDGSNKTPHSLSLPTDNSVVSSVASSRWLHETAIQPPSLTPSEPNRRSAASTPRSTGKLKKGTAAGTKTRTHTPLANGKQSSKEKAGSLGKKTRVRARQMRTEGLSLSYGYSPGHSAVVDDNHSHYSSYSAPPNLSQHPPRQDVYTSPAYLAYASNSPSSSQYGISTQDVSATAVARDRFTSPVPSSSRPPRHPGTHDLPLPPRPQSAPNGTLRHRAPAAASPRPPSSAHSTPARATRKAEATPVSTGQRSTSRGARRVAGRSPAGGSMTIRTQRTDVLSPGAGKVGAARGSFGKTTW